MQVSTYSKGMNFGLFLLVLLSEGHWTFGYLVGHIVVVIAFKPF